MRRHTLATGMITALATVALLASSPLIPAQAQEADRPNILWLTAEDMSPTLGCFGDTYAYTPNLDAFAAEAVSFRHGFSPAPYTLAGIASLLTGKLPDRHGLVDKALRLRDDERTLAEILRDAGYPMDQVTQAPSELEAVRVLLDRAQPDEVLLLLVQVDLDAVVAEVEQRGGVAG